MCVLSFLPPSFLRYVPGKGVKDADLRDFFMGARGWLLKRGAKGIMGAGGYKKRYFILDGDRLHYFMDEADLEGTRQGAITLTNVTGVTFDLDGKVRRRDRWGLYGGAVRGGVREPTRY